MIGQNIDIITIRAAYKTLITGKEKVIEGKTAFHTLDIQTGSGFRVDPVHDTVGICHHAVVGVFRDQKSLNVIGHRELCQLFTAFTIPFIYIVVYSHYDTANISGISGILLYLHIAREGDGI